MLGNREQCWNCSSNAKAIIIHQQWTAWQETAHESDWEGYSTKDKHNYKEWMDNPL